MTTENNESSRFSLWTALTGFSIVVLADLASTTSDLPERTRPMKWGLSVASISLSLGFLAILAHALARNRFVGTPIEGGLISLCVAFWAAGLPSIMNPENFVAVIGLNGPVKANIYFFSWGCFAMTLMLAGSFARQVVQVQRPENMSKRALWWFALCVTSLITMSVSSRTFHLADCKNAIAEAESGCKRVKFAISLGVISGFLSCIMGLIALMIPLILESIIALIMVILWCFGVGYITFGSKAPATEVGNFYFSVWASFIVALFVTSDAVSETYERLQEEQGKDTTTTTTTTGTTTGNETKPEVPEV